MSDMNKSEFESDLAKNKKEVLRVALDSKATHVFAEMTTELKKQNQFLKFHPSELVSFIITHYAESYFKGDLDILVAAFFDYHSFMKVETEKAKGQDNFMEVMQQALEESKKIRNKLNKSTRVTKCKKKEYKPANTGNNTL